MITTKYKSIFQEEDALDKLTDPDLIDKLVDWFQKNPYPKDHQQFHKFAEDLGMDADDLEIYVYAMVCAFVCGGNFNKSGKSEKDFSDEEKKMGNIVEAEHCDVDNNNPVVKKICDYYRNRIRLDHNADNKNYYADGKAGKLQLEELK